MLVIRQLKGHWRKMAVLCVLLLGHSVASLLPPYITRLLVDRGLFAGDVGTTVFCSFMLVFLASVQGYLSVKMAERTSSLGEAIVLDIRNEVLARALSLDEEAAGKLGTGYIMSRIDEADAIKPLFSTNNIVVLGGMIQSIGSFLVLWATNPLMSFIALIPTVFFVVLGLRVTNVFNELLQIILEKQANLFGLISDCLLGRSELMLTSSVRNECEKLAIEGRELGELHTRQATAFSAVGESYGVAGVFISGAVYIACVYGMGARSFTAGRAISAAQYASKMYSPALSFASAFTSIQPSIAAVRRVEEFLERSKDLDCANNVRGNLIREIRSLRAVSLSVVTEFHGGTRVILPSATFSIESPGLYVIKGPNGSGKTTLAKILVGLRTKYSGSIEVNGIQLRDIDIRALRRLTAMVTQQPFVFNRTVRENVLCGCRPSRFQYYQALHAAGVDAICERLPVGDKTVVGENGALLSGGEKRRIAIARALIRNARLIILDEPLANLDKESIVSIIKVLRTLSASRIVVVIDHSGVFERDARQVIEIGNR